VANEVLAAYRKAFDEMIKDAEFIADADKRRLVLDPVGGAEVQDNVAATMATPAAAVEKLSAILTIN
jgi:tripartite-type tricarboxylate transporter receptor subunit TctC